MGPSKKLSKAAKLGWLCSFAIGITATVAVCAVLALLGDHGGASGPEREHGSFVFNIVRYDYGDDTFIYVERVYPWGGFVEFQLSDGAVYSSYAEGERSALRQLEPSLVFTVVAHSEILPSGLYRVAMFEIYPSARAIPENMVKLTMQQLAECFRDFIGDGGRPDQLDWRAQMFRDGLIGMPVRHRLVEVTTGEDSISIELLFR